MPSITHVIPFTFLGLILVCFRGSLLCTGSLCQESIVPSGSPLGHDLKSHISFPSKKKNPSVVTNYRPLKMVKSFPSWWLEQVHHCLSQVPGLCQTRLCCAPNSLEEFRAKIFRGPIEMVPFGLENQKESSTLLMWQERGETLTAQLPR